MHWSERAGTDLESAFDDFLTALTHSGGYDVESHSLRWQDAQLVLSSMWQRLQFEMKRRSMLG